MTNSSLQPPTKIEDPLRLSTLIERVRYAAATSNSNPIYNYCGFFIERDGADLIVTASDGHRLAQARAADVPLPLPKGGLLVSAGDLDALDKTLHREKWLYPRAIVTVTLDARPSPTLVFTLRGREIMLLRNAGEFPNYRQAISTVEGTPISVDAAILAVAARELAEVHESHQVRVQREGDHLCLRAHREFNFGSVCGEAKIPVAGVGACRFLVNGHYLADALGAAAGRVELWPPGEGESWPMMVRDGDGYLAAVSPMRERTQS